MQQNYIRLLESGIQELEPSQWRILRGGQADQPYPGKVNQKKFFRVVVFGNKFEYYNFITCVVIVSALH